MRNSVQRYTGIFSKLRYLKHIGIANCTIEIPRMPQITCHRVSTFFAANMADSTDHREIVGALMPKKKATSPVWDHFRQRGTTLDSVLMAKGG